MSIVFNMAVERIEAREDNQTKFAPGTAWRPSPEVRASTCGEGRFRFHMLKHSSDPKISFDPTEKRKRHLLPPDGINRRLRLGWSVQRAVETPLKILPKRRKNP